MVTLNANDLKRDNCKHCKSNCEHAGKDREFCYTGKSCKVEEQTSNGIFAAILDKLPSVYTDPAAEYMTNGNEILTLTEAAAETIADFLQVLFDREGNEHQAHTGYYDPEEDERDGETDSNTGYYYIDFD